MFCSLFAALFVPQFSEFVAEGFLDDRPVKTETVLYREWKDGKGRHTLEDVPGEGRLVTEVELSGEKKGGGNIQIYVPTPAGRKYLTGKYKSKTPGRLDPLKLCETGAVVTISYKPGKGSQIVATRVYHERAVVEPRVPEDGATLRDNTPTFAWWPAAAGQSLEIASDADFKEIVRELDPEEFPAVTCAEPLPPGRYFWRIRSVHAGTSVARSFVQTAATTDDTTAPLILADPCFTENPSAAIETTVRDGATNRVFVSRPPPTGWKVGLNVLPLEVSDSAGNTARAERWVMYRPKSRWISWDASRGMKVGDGFFYPVGMFTVKGIDDIEKFRDWGVNFVQSYQWGKVKEVGRDSEFGRVMKYLALNRMYGVVSPKYRDGDPHVGLLGRTARRIGELVDYEAIAAWYLYDEPDIHANRPSPTELRRVNALVKALDPTRARFVVCGGDHAAELFEDACSVYMSEAYHVSTAKLQEKYRDIAARLPRNGHFNIMNIAGGHEARNIVPGVPRNRQLLARAFLGMAYGSGFIHYWWPRRDFDGPEAAIAGYFAELKKLVPYFAAPGEVSVREEGGRVVWEKRYRGAVTRMACDLATFELEIGGDPLSATRDCRFPYRGLLIDEARHFLGAAVVRRVLDRMASLGYNVLHWHLTDNEAWRVEIDAYPKLTEGVPHYTKDEIRELVAYAKARGIEVMPEVDFPGHSKAALSIYPELSCGGKRLGRALCLGRESTFRMYERVYAEVAELFPGEFLHIGGDEVAADAWSDCADCAARKKSLGVDTVAEYQAWATKRLVRLVKGLGKTPVGWDEILEGGGIDDVVVQVWRADAAVAKRLRSCRARIINSPVTHCYYNMPRGLENDPIEYPKFVRSRPVTIDRVRSFGPYLGIPEDCRDRVIGSEALAWGEGIPDEKTLDALLWYRAETLSEILLGNRK